MPETTVSRFLIGTAVSLERREAEWRTLALSDSQAASLLVIWLISFSSCPHLRGKQQTRSGNAPGRASRIRSP